MLLRALSNLPRRIVHGFSTRVGGVSTGDLASLNLAVRGTDTTAIVNENWRRVLVELSGTLDLSSLALVQQVHGRQVRVVTQGRGPSSLFGEADALVTTEPGVVLGIRTADCVPILFATSGGIAAAHAGWRGVAADIVGETVRILCSETHASPDEVHAVIGPHICAECYEVGGEVIDKIHASGVPLERFVRRERFVDLRAAVEVQLRRMGVEKINHVRRCTATDPELYSHRANGPSTGRLAAVIARL